MVPISKSPIQLYTTHLTDPQAPEIVSLYALNIAPSMIRLKIRQDFEKNRDITDLPVIDMLLHKNQQEYQETMNCWKQEVGLSMCETGWEADR
jgi:hypothetical protein